MNELTKQDVSASRIIDCDEFGELLPECIEQAQAYIVKAEFTSNGDLKVYHRLVPDTIVIDASRVASYREGG